MFCFFYCFNNYLANGSFFALIILKIYFTSYYLPFISIFMEVFVF